MSEAQRFWEQPVRPTVKADLAGMDVYRADRFPAEGGPVPWLDRPEADALIAGALERGEITEAEADLCRKWWRDGYVILEGFYPAERLDETWAAYEAGIASGEVVPPDEPLFEGDPLPGRTANVHFAIPAMDEMLFEPRMRRLVSLLLGARAQPFQTIIGHKSSQQLAHSDSIHMTTYPTGYLAANWIAYEDIDPDSGPLVYYPGSHRLPYLLSEDLGIPREADYTSYQRTYEPAIQALIAEHGLEPRHFLPKKGDVLLWHANLLHGGSPVRNPRLSRKALVCHFFAEGCVCYHDLSGSLAHTQLGLNMYKYPRAAAEPTSRLAHYAFRARRLGRRMMRALRPGG
jgi:hypothetical protein